jgi:hypothetical protein
VELGGSRGDMETFSVIQILLGGFDKMCVEEEKNCALIKCGGVSNVILLDRCPKMGFQCC